MKRKPRSVNSRGSMRRSMRLSIEKRKPRSASAARLSCSIGPMRANGALGELEHQRRRDRAIGVDQFEQLRKPGISQGRAGEIAEQADVAVLEQQPAHHLHATEHRQGRRASASASPLRHKAGNPPPRRPRRVRLEPRHRFVIAHLALRQRHDRLQVEIDPLGLDGAGHGATTASRSRPAKIATGCAVGAPVPTGVPHRGAIDGGRRRRLQGD